jgi:hypothetical protein
VQSCFFITCPNYTPILQLLQQYRGWLSGMSVVAIGHYPHTVSLHIPMRYVGTYVVHRRAIA